MSTVSLTYAELAERLGISVDGARMKVKRHRWPKAKGNGPKRPKDNGHWPKPKDKCCPQSEVLKGTPIGAAALAA
jgi:hypothetical protein